METCEDVRVREQLRDRLIFAREDQQKENDRFYTRSAFFWGFIAASFVAYGATLNVHSDFLSTAVASFGFASSAFWTLINRGSTYWQGVFVARVQAIEEELYGQRFYLSGQVHHSDNSHPWIRSRSFSMTKLTIAFSDFTVFIWGVLVSRSVFLLASPSTSAIHDKAKALAIVFFPVLSLGYVMMAAAAAHRPSLLRTSRRLLRPPG